ncbi:MAG: 16S rRNA (cytosine(1402)-N(4))-methyltransferase RsmH [Candidatus Aminicenantes bacterium]|nr:16S rRNA (cytosine(1402)-N(4))-methyltransferase RsmH [Candidatus Aminicenantes bacterium]
MSRREHIPVLLEETLDLLDIRREGTYIDGTLGMAGHASEILKRNPKARLIGLDLDESSILKARDYLSPYANRVDLYHADFRYIPELDVDFTSVRGILLDLGMSSFQLDAPDRGFSHTLDGPLDMRMDARNKMTAAKLLNKTTEAKLAQIFREYGELKQANKLARRIATIRRTQKIESTTQLRRIVEDVCRWIPQKGKIHPAAKVFQALRIEVNQELQGLGEFLEQLVRLVRPGARIAVISFHSLEDRIVKHTLVGLARLDDGPGLIEILTKKPVTASEEEIARNSRARSAKLRAAEKRPYGS